MMNNKQIQKLTLIATASALLTAYASAAPAAQYGKLSNYDLAKTYSLQQVTDTAYSTICAGVESDSAQCLGNLNNLHDIYGFDINKIAQNDLHITGVKAFNITYNTPNYIPNGSFKYQSREVSGTVFIPSGIDANKIKGVILLYHPTMYNYNDYSPSENLITGASYPAMYAVHGYIVLLADLPGFGVDKTEMHPYIFPEINVIAGINMLKANNQLLNAIGLKVNKKLPLILNGFSEGGMLSQKASYMIQHNQVSLAGTNTKLALTVPMSGAFDISGKQIQLEYANATAPESNEYRIQNQYVAALVKPGLAGYAVNSYNYYTATKCQDVLIDAFCNFSESGVSAKNIASVFEAESIMDTMSTQDMLYKLAQRVSAYDLNNNSIAALMQPHPSQGYIDAFNKVTLLNWKTNSPIEYVHLKRDSLLTPYNSIEAYNTVSAKSGVKLVHRIEIDNDKYLEGSAPHQIDHNNPIMYPVSLTIFDKYFAK